ncbi:MAG: hypothetical protein AAF404_11165, partial [Pseudomonadota bacterium]
MQKTVLASLIVLALSACDSNTVDVQSGSGIGAPGSESADAGNPEVDPQTGTDSDTGTDDGDKIDDDAGSSTSDGGQVNDDSGSSTSDGGQTNDDSGSATSDGGQTNDDSGSSTSDGGSNDNQNTETDNDGSGDNNNDGGSFESDNTGGNILYQSSLSTGNSEVVCTTLSDQNNFSNIYVGDFILHNNAWRPWRAFEGYEWEQCIYTNTNGVLAGWYYDWGPGRTGINGNPNASGDFYVRSYPELIYGVKDEFRTSAPQSQTGFPVRFGDMPNISIDYAYDGP